MPSVGDIYSYSYEGYSTMMFVDELDDSGFYYYSVRLLEGTDQVEIGCYREYMANQMKKVLGWETSDKLVASLLLIQMAAELAKDLEELCENLINFKDVTPDDENFKELVALGMEINHHSERHYALGKMGDVVFGEEEVKRASSSNWLP